MVGGPSPTLISLYMYMLIPTSRAQPSPAQPNPAQPNPTRPAPPHQTTPHRGANTTKPHPTARASERKSTHSDHPPDQFSSSGSSNRDSRSLLASKHSDSCWRRSTAIRLAGVEAQRQPASSPPPQSQTSAASACSRSAASRAARSAASACCFWTCPRWAFLSGELPQQLEAGPTAGVEALLPP